MFTIMNLTPRYLIGACLALAGLTVLMLIIAAWQWHSDWRLAHTSSVIPAMTNTSTATELVAALPSEHLFGKSFSEGGDMPISNLQLRVTGIMKFSNDNGDDISKVTIAIAGAPGKIYQKGDALPYGVKIYDITNNTVVVENNGHLEKLPLPREPLQFKPRENAES